MKSSNRKIKHAQEKVNSTFKQLKAESTQNTYSITVRWMSECNVI